MLKLKEIANDCSFTNSDEVVKFLFLTHNQNSRVKDALLEKMKGTSTLTECLTIAKTVESTIETEKLSKTFLQNVNKPETIGVDEINGSKRQNCSKSGGRGQRFNQSASRKGGKRQGKCRNCGNNHPPRKCPAYGKECFRCKKPNHFKEFCRSNPQNRSQSPGGGGRQTRKDMNEVDKEDDPFSMYEYDAINVRTVCFTTNVKYTHSANIAFDEVSSDRKLQHLLIDVTVSNKIGNKTTVHVKLDTGASSNLLPYNMFKEIFPQVSVKELCHSSDTNVCLEAYNKSSIKQLGTCCLTVRHGKQSCLCHFFVVPDYCHPILGLNDIHALNLIAIHCHVTDKWSSGNLCPMRLYPTEEDESSFSVFDAVEEKPGSMLTKDAITNGCFSKIFSGIGQFPIEPVSIILSEDAEPVQKPARRVPVALKDKFKQELKSMEKAGIISKLDCNTPTPWLNSYVIVKKPNGSLRICLDPTNLNKYIVQPVCNSHTLDDVSYLLKDAKHFSVFDATKGFFSLTHRCPV